MTTLATSTTALHDIDLPLPLLRKGKVRSMYDLDDRILMVASDRISAFDCVIPNPIPHKGAVLTQLSAFWFDRTTDIVDNHRIANLPDAIATAAPELADTRDVWAYRGMLVDKADPFPVECVVRGFISGSAWKEYRAHGTLAGEPLPENLQESEDYPEPIFSPATKAEEGLHDENITFNQMCDIVGVELATELRDISMALYMFGRDTLRERGIILADTKYEFGRAADGRIILIDEVMTPDSSRFWPADQYEVGGTQPSLDKQPVRDHLEGVVQRGEWDRMPPAPELPQEIVTTTSERYLEAYRRVAGHELYEATS
ncbi:MAG: phosphoribosylaminoimidazolesuccinocarboxamide synthase [Gemmatimonadetes bacterium]|nr:phosphoribosylaminoimidazolesuccinocarboxamide synthase [Gemmatimonadota bacterium]